MEKIPIAEELFQYYSENTALKEDDYEYLVDKKSFIEALLKFTRLHVQAALKAASENADADLETIGWLSELHSVDPFIEGVDYEIGINRSSILESYSLENIK